jgi:hypothetical protein
MVDISVGETINWGDLKHQIPSPTQDQQAQLANYFGLWMKCLRENKFY